MFVRAVALGALLCAAGVAHAGDKPLYQPVPAWVRPSPPIEIAKLTDTDPILLVMDQQQRFDGDQVWTYAELAMRISSPQVLTQSGTVPLPWNPSKGDLIVHQVEILRGSEKIDVLASDKKFTVLQREQQLERAALNGMLTATLPVEGLRVGDVLRITFSITRRDPALHGHVQAVAPLLADPVRLKFGRMRLLWPDKTALRWRSYGAVGDLKPVDAGGGMRELSVSLPLAKPAEMPSDAPLRFKPIPILDATDYAGWTDMSKDMAQLYRTDGLIAPGSPLAAEVARIAAATQDPRERTAMALQLVQDKVRYLFRGMDDGDYVPQAPAQTWSVRYGDCKAKSLMLLAMLRSLGIDAEAVLVNTEIGDMVATRLSMPGVFNHVIVRATIGGESLWLDGTGGGARLADIGDVPPFRYALPLRDAGAELLPMPLRANARPTTDAEIELDATAGVLLPTPFKARVTLRGSKVEMLRVMAAQAGKDELDGMIDGVVGEFVGSSSELVDRSFKYDEATATALVTASGVSYPDWDKDKGRYKTKLDSAIGSISFSPDRARPAWRDIPVSSGDYADTRVRTRIHLPAGGAGFAVEGDRTLPKMIAGVGLERSVALEGEWLTVTDRATSGIAEVAPADIPATRAQVAQAKGRLLKAIAPADTSPLYRQIEAAKRAKALDPILAVYAAQIKEKPEEVESYTDRAWFLERIYDRAGAIRDLDKAIELSATSDNYMWRSRLRSALRDDAGALADAKAALELDPGSTGAVQTVASLLARSGKVDAALTMLAEHADQGGDDRVGYMNAQASVLADTGKVEEGIAMLDGIIDASPGKPDLLNSRCWMKGTRNVQLDAALKDCTKGIELAENPSSIYDSRAMVYFRMNRMQEALADLDAALDESPDQAASLYLRGVIRKQLGLKEGDGDLAAARMIWPRIDEDYARYGIKP